MNLKKVTLQKQKEKTEILELRNNKQLRNLGRSVLQIPLWCPLFLEIEAPFLCYREGTGKDQKVTPAHAISQIPSAKNIQYTKVPYFAVLCPEPHQYLSYWKVSFKTDKATKSNLINGQRTQKGHL